MVHRGLELSSDLANSPGAAPKSVITPERGARTESRSAELSASAPSNSRRARALASVAATLSASACACW